MFRSHFTLSYFGAQSDEHLIDLYDVGTALIGFQRSLALTVHAVLNDEIIVKAPNLRGAEIYARPAVAGSWRMKVVVVGGVLTGAYNILTAPKETPLGNLVCSAYDYVVSESLGFHVDYTKTLQKQYEELQKSDKEKIKPISQSRLDSVIEKTQSAIINIHRPIVNSKTSTSGQIKIGPGGSDETNTIDFDRRTFDYVSFSERTEAPEEFVGRVSSYNTNTFKGRVYVEELGRPISFELGEAARAIIDIKMILSSLDTNAFDRFNNTGLIKFSAFVNRSRSGQVKYFLIVDVIRISE